MAAQQQVQLTRSEITLRGSVEIVTEFFGFAVNNILYQRGIYPPEHFASLAKYGLTIMVSTNEGLKIFLAQVLRQVSGSCARVRGARQLSDSAAPALPIRRFDARTTAHCDSSASSCRVVDKGRRPQARACHHGCVPRLPRRQSQQQPDSCGERTSHSHTPLHPQSSPFSPPCRRRNPGGPRALGVQH